VTLGLRAAPHDPATPSVATLAELAGTLDLDRALADGRR
jgi:hypothetical protein